MNAKKRLKKTKCVLLVHVKLYWKWIGSHNSLNVIYWAIRSNKLKHYFSFNITIWFYCPVIYQRTWVDKQIRRFRTNLCSEIFFTSGKCDSRFPERWTHKFILSAANTVCTELVKGTHSKKNQKITSISRHWYRNWWCKNRWYQIK